MKIRRDRLQALLDGTGKTQSNIAIQAGISRQTIGAWINEGRKAQYSSVSKVAEVLKCPVEEIAEYEHGEAIEESGDYIRSRIEAIYDDLDRSSRARLLAAAESLLADNPRIVLDNPKAKKRDENGLNTEIAARIIREIENPTRTTPRGKDKGMPLLDIEVECPTCKKPFFASRFQKGKIACPTCGQHVFIGKKG